MKTHTVLLIGSSRVGKSFIITRVRIPRPSPLRFSFGAKIRCASSDKLAVLLRSIRYSYDPSRWDRDSRSITISGVTHKLEIGDLSTATPTQCLTNYDLRDRVIDTAEAYVLVYDITSAASLQSIKEKHPEA